VELKATIQWIVAATPAPSELRSRGSVELKATIQWIVAATPARWS
jgi:hypothetical protein